MSRDAQQEEAPPDRELRARQAYGFFYLRVEEETGALSSAKRPVRSRKEDYEAYLGTTIVSKMLEASSLEGFLEHMHYRVNRDGEGRIISLLRQDDALINPALDYRVLKELATYVLGAELVFANEFGDGWEWKADGDVLRHCSGHLTVEPKGR